LEIGIEIVPSNLPKFLRSLSSVIGHANFISLPECPFGRPLPSPLILSVVAKGLGLEVIPNYRVMDRSELGFISEIMALSEVGIRRVVIVRGDLPSIGMPTSLNPVRAIELIKEHGIDIEVGVATYTKPNEALRARIEAGADFVVTQPIQDVGELSELLDFLGDIPLYTMIMPGMEDLDLNVLREMGLNEVRNVDYKALLQDISRTKVRGVIISSPKGVSKALEILR
jgi:homocysteine S-methyltransferase